MLRFIDIEIETTEKKIYRVKGVKKSCRIFVEKYRKSSKRER